MGRIKQGLDYFPLSTDLVHDRIVRRIMKREGDSALSVLLYTLSYLYSGEGYYVRADDDFCDEISDQLFSTDNERVHRILHLLVDYGFFDAALYHRYGILTSVSIQRQYLFITKRRSYRYLLPGYCLLPGAETEQSAESKCKPSAQETTVSTKDIVAETPDDVYKISDTATESRNDANNFPYIKEKERKENILPNPPCQGGDEERDGGDIFETEEDGGGNGVYSTRNVVCDRKNDLGSREHGANSVGNKAGCEQNESACNKVAKKKRDFDQADIDRICPPTDGVPRNFPGLLDNLRLYHIPPAEQYAIVMKSNYGEIGGKVWQGFGVIRGSGGKIKLPGHYLLSVLK